MVPSQFLSVVLEEDNGSGSEEDTHAYSQRSKWWECDLSQVQLVQARVKMVHDNYYFTLFKTIRLQEWWTTWSGVLWKGVFNETLRDVPLLLASKVDYYNKICYTLFG